MSEIFSKILKDKNGKVLKVSEKTEQLIIEETGAGAPPSSRHTKKRSRIKVLIEIAASAAAGAILTILTTSFF